MKKKIPFNKFSKMLTGLEFTMHHIPGSHFYFEHPPSKTLLMYREYKPKELVSAGDLVSARKFLVERDILEDEDEFEEVLQKAMADGEVSA